MTEPLLSADGRLRVFFHSSTAMAEARKMGRRCVGYEVEGRFREMIAHRTQILGPAIGSPGRLGIGEIHA